MAGLLPIMGLEGLFVGSVGIADSPGEPCIQTGCSGSAGFGAPRVGCAAWRVRPPGAPGASFYSPYIQIGLSGSAA